MGPLGMDAPRPMARTPPGTASRPAVLGPTRPDTWAAMRFGRNPRPAAPRRGDRRDPAPVLAASTPPRTRGRDVAGGDLAARHPKAARARRSTHHLPIPARHRQHRDHRRRPPKTGTHGPRRPEHRHTPLRHTARAAARGRASARPHIAAATDRDHEHAETKARMAIARRRRAGRSKRSSGRGSPRLHQERWPHVRRGLAPALAFALLNAP
jgi:hypothetical protein